MSLITKRERIIINYIEGYNTFDIDQMVKDLDDRIVFKNISNGEESMILYGLKAFKDQAKESTRYFSSRTQTIKSFTHSDDETIVDIDYHAILAADLPNGLKKGDELKMEGKSIFQFASDKIVQLTDVS